MPTPDERAQIAAIGRELEQAVEGVVQDITRDVARELAESTPKDSGAASASWRPSVGRAKSRRVSRNAAGVARAKGEQEAGLAEVSGYRLRDGKAFVSSAQPYVLSLNDGHSQREPAAFIQRSVEGAVRRARARPLRTRVVGRGRG